MRYLYNQDEAITLESQAVIRRHPMLSDGRIVATGNKGEKLPALPAGHYLIKETEAPGVERERYLGVVGDYYTVMQMTIGSFTSDLFDHPLHSSRVPGTYYVGVGQVQKDSTFRTYQQEYGDGIYPHIMANSVGAVLPEFAQNDPNWDSLSASDIEKRLRIFDKWWQDQGLAPLDGFATYTPSNSLIAAMKNLGWKVLHSIIPEQNWSDGRWCINHWGMPNQPFYVANDDFRKPTERDKRNVIAMSMNSYHLYMPHVVHFGDNVLSPSHFLRWHRAVESGREPERFTNFLVDYLQASREHPDPFFLIAGFEFGRSFGVRAMTDHNRRGMERVIEMSKTNPIVFATPKDVTDYYEKFMPRPRPVVFTQRDYLAGTRIMDKPINSGPSIGMEMDDFKAVFSHLEPLPYYHYDYTEAWNYAYDDMNVPDDYAQDDKNALQVEIKADTVTLTAAAPLKRAVPVALWDHTVTGEKIEFTLYQPPVLDDGRRHTVVVVPAGWSGETSHSIQQVSIPPAAEFSGSTHPQWRVQEIGRQTRRHCFLYLDSPLPESVELPFEVPAPCRIDSREKPLGEFKAGDRLTLKFDNRHSWYRFWGLSPAQIQPGEEAIKILDGLNASSEKFSKEAPELLKKRQLELDSKIEALIPSGAKRVYHMDCFGNCALGERSRAVKFDRVVYNHAGISARELSDGGMAFYPGFNFWIHPRGMHCEISGVTPETVGCDEINVHLFALSPKEQLWKYHVSLSSGGKILFETDSPWECPCDVSSDALLTIPIKVADIVDGHLDCGVRSAQTGVLDDWFRDGGFIATLQRLVITGK